MVRLRDITIRTRLRILVVLSTAGLAVMLGLAAWVLYCGYAACTIAFMLMRIRGFVGDQFAVWVPPFLILALVISRWLSRAGARNPQLTPSATST